MDFTSIGLRHHDWVERMGWHNKTVLEALAMIASEIGETAAECMGDTPTSSYGEELADIVLRTTDLAIVEGIDLNRVMMDVIVTWRDTSLRGAFAEMMVEVARWVNAARADVLDDQFAVCMARVMHRVVDMAERAEVDLEAEVLRKIEINEDRGTRGRRI